MKVWTWTLAAAVGTVALGTALDTAKAGVKFTVPVVVWPDYQLASGSLGSARASADTGQYIGCWTNTGEYGHWGECSARDAGGTQASCYSSKPLFVEQMRHVDGDDSITFWWDANGECTMIFVDQSSYNMPNTP